LDNGRFYRGPHIHTQFLQAYAKTACRNQPISCIRMQAGWTLAWRG
jgi:hypothetical protein